jgi:predicted  nucleic acid-binding Zn-ribbon protein
MKIDALQSEIVVLESTKQDREDKVKAMYEEQKKLRSQILVLQDEVIVLKNEIEENEAQHQVQLKRVVESQIDNSKGANDIKVGKYYANITK